MGALDSTLAIYRLRERGLLRIFNLRNTIQVQGINLLEQIARTSS